MLNYDCVKGAAALRPDNLVIVLFIHISPKLHLAKAECIFYRKQKTAASGSSYGPLNVCTTDQASLAICHLADKINDSYARAQITHYNTEDIKAREFQYHRTCLRWTSEPRNQPAIDMNEKEAGEQCFGFLKGYVQEKVIDEGVIFRMSAISDAYRQFQRILHLSEKGDKN